MNNKLLSYSLIGLQIILLILVSVVLVSLPKNRLGGTTNYDAVDVADGYYVDAVAVIDGSGNLSLTGSRTITIASVTTLNGAVVISSSSRIYPPVVTGAITVLTGSSTVTVTAAQACAGIIGYASSSITGASTFNLPTAEAMFADCLTTNGDDKTMWVRNMTASTTVITAGSASTTIAIDNGGTVTLGALGTARITFKRLASNLMFAFVSVFKP